MPRPKNVVIVGTGLIAQGLLTAINFDYINILAFIDEWDSTARLFFQDKPVLRGLAEINLFFKKNEIYSFDYVFIACGSTDSLKTRLEQLGLPSAMFVPLDFATLLFTEQPVQPDEFYERAGAYLSRYPGLTEGISLEALAKSDSAARFLLPFSLDIHTALVAAFDSENTPAGAGDRSKLQQENLYYSTLASLMRSMKICWISSAQAMEDAQALYQLLAPQKQTALPKVRIGGPKDGGYVLLEPGTVGILYSFGVSDKAPFDLEMAERGFEVYQYDGTIDVPPDQHPRMFFHKYNITGSEPPEPGCKNITQILHDHGHMHRDDIILQIDIEWGEWEFFKKISTDEIKKFKQIIVEFHGFYPGSSAFKKHLAVLEKIHATHCPIHVHGNNCAGATGLPNGRLVPYVLEVTYARRGDAGGDAFRFFPCTDYYPTPLDRPNNIHCVDLPLGFFY